MLILREVRQIDFFETLDEFDIFLKAVIISAPFMMPVLLHSS